MTDYERTVLEHYQLSSAYPMEWPAEKDQSDASDEEDTKPVRNGMMRRSKSRYSALEKASDRKSVLPGLQRTDNGKDNLVQKDEPDPLGSSESVVRILRGLGVPVQDDPRERNKYLLSSTTFSPALFLSKVHRDASTQDLLTGLDILSSSIDQKSASLKKLVESNFERFVRAKATIDNVYTEMKYRGVEPTAPPTPRNRPNSRHASRNSFRASSGNQAVMAFALPEGKKKNALTKESEYGVLGIKTPLLDVSAKAEEVWGPAVRGQKDEDSLKIMSGTVERYKEVYEVAAAITDSIKRKDFESVSEEYAKARRSAEDAKRLAENLGSTPPTDPQIFQMLLAARVWNDVEEQIEHFKDELWHRLMATQSISSRLEGSGGSQDQHLELISVLLELGVAENPITGWLRSRMNHLDSKIRTTADRCKVEIEIFRRKLANGKGPEDAVIASHFRSLTRHTTEEKLSSIDSSEIIEFWERVHTYLTDMLASQGILGEVADFKRTVQNFIDGTAQRSLPVGINGESRRHHQLSEQEVYELQIGTVDLVNGLRDGVFSLFVEAPPEDISALFSPMPLTPRTPAPSGAGSLTPIGLKRFNYDPNSIPPLSPTVEAWKDYAFWPPRSNTLSGVHYLGKFLALMGTGASEMATMFPTGSDGTSVERLKMLVSEARERCVTAICAAWIEDAKMFKVVEDWTRSPEQRDLTRMPATFSAFESAILTGMQKILYISGAISKSDSTNVVFPPPSSLLQMARGRFMTSLYKALSGMVENARKPAKSEGQAWDENDDLASPVSMVAASSMGAGTVNANDRNVCMLLTLSNLGALQREVVPNLTAQFENAFSDVLTEEKKRMRDTLATIHKNLFEAYTGPACEQLGAIIRKGVLSADWPPLPDQKPKEVRTYAYDVLLSLVLVHSQVSTTASTLTTQVLSYLLEEVSKELFKAFQQRQKYSLLELMQATLDLEFITQALSQYKTEKAGEMHSQIYAQLDSGTDHEARLKLQSELPEMRAVLKRLREAGRNEFSCFKRKSKASKAPNGVNKAGQPPPPPLPGAAGGDAAYRKPTT